MTDPKIVWTPEAKARLDKAPFFIRPLAKRKIEKAAKAKGEHRITLALVEQIKKQEMGR